MTIKLWRPQERQLHAMTATFIDELFFGGARGGGKSDFLLADFLSDVTQYKGYWQGIIFRKTYPELEEIVSRSREMYLPLGAKWNEQKREWRFLNGAKLRMRYLEHPRDADRYQGHQYTWIGWDELTQHTTDEGYNKLKACLRCASADIPTKRIRCSGNPGGAGHFWVKSYFIDPYPTGYEPYIDPDTQMSRMYIPSLVKDNTALMTRDPGYVNRLKGLGSEQLVRAWLDGDWNAVIGAYFTEFSTAKHIVKPFEIPEDWMRFRAVDWGSSSPFGVLWCAVSDGSISQYPDNSMIVYREIYGGDNGVGWKMRAEDVAQMIVDRSYNEKYSYSVGDTSMFDEDGGISIAERFHKTGVYLRPSDKRRLPGWQAIRSRLIGEDDKPRLFIFSTCQHLIRTLPALQHDDRKPEDLDTESDDHLADALRYACMSRPYTKPKEKAPKRLKGLQDMTLNELWEENSRRIRR